MEPDYKRLIDSIPPAESITIPDVPKGLCESVSVQFAYILAIATQYQIENRQLRILTNKFAREATVYHNIIEALNNYPILTDSDVGITKERGNWVLPLEVEHLQRTIIRLHGLLIGSKKSK